MKEKEYTESYEWKTIMLEFLLSILLLSLVSTITTLTKEENIFQWTECLSIGVSAFLIVFIGLHENRKVFQNTVKEYEEINLLKKISLVLLIPIIIYILYVIPLSNSFLFGQLNDCIFDFAFNFIRYFCFSGIVSYELYMCGLLFYSEITEFLSVQNIKK